MYKIIGADGKEYGPVTLEQLRQWIVEGRANTGTLAQGEGSADWKALSEFPELATALGSVANLAASAPVAAALSPDDLAARDYHVDIGACLRRGWELVKGNFGVLVGGAVISLVVQMAIGLVPILGGIAGMIVGGVFTGGLYWLFIRALRGEEARVGDVFAGFSRAFKDLALGQIVMSLLIIACMIPFIVAIVVMAVASAHHQKPSPAMIAVMVALLVACLPVVVYLATGWIFSLPLIIDRQMGFWEAMKLSRHLVRKHWWGVFGAMFVFGLVGMLGIIVCGIGVLMSMPVCIAAMMYLYEDIFGQPAV